MKVFRTTRGVLVEAGEKQYLVEEPWDALINRDSLYQYLTNLLPGVPEVIDGRENQELLAPVENQEVWAAGVTYYRSKVARREESKGVGGGDFYERVYQADRPELFFKSTPGRVVGPGGQVRIRKDSHWNVPEPELTLFINSKGEIAGYTIGNDMSSRDIEGENPLYLPQAKTYDGSAAVGPCIYLTEKPFPKEAAIGLDILRTGGTVFNGSTEVSRIKREFTELTGYLFREMSFPYGTFLMTGTGIVPPDDFTLQPGDEIRISIDHIGTLINFVA